MTQETFKKLVEEGYVTEVGAVTSYLSSPTSLEKVTVKDLADRGFICKQIDYKLWDAYVESQIEEPAEIIKPKDDDDVNPIIAPVKDDVKKNEEIVPPVEVKPTTSDPEHTDEPNEIEVENDVKSDEIEVETENEE